MARPKKRKHRDDEDARKKRKSKGWDDDSLLDLDAGINRAYASMDGQLLADHLSQKTARFGSDLSSVELSDLYISGTRLVVEQAH